MRLAAAAALAGKCHTGQSMLNKRNMAAHVLLSAGAIAKQPYSSALHVRCAGTCKGHKLQSTVTSSCTGSRDGAKPPDMLHY